MNFCLRVWLLEYQNDGRTDRQTDGQCPPPLRMTDPFLLPPPLSLRSGPDKKTKKNIGGESCMNATPSRNLQYY